MRGNNSWAQWQGATNSSNVCLQEIRNCFRSGRINDNADLYGKLFEMGRWGLWEEVMWAIREALPFSSTLRLH
jgi:hypothetical protein